MTLDPIVIEDTLIGEVSCPDTSLIPEAFTSCTASYQITQADVDAGTVHNEATATGTPPIGAAVSNTDTTDTQIAQEPAVTLDKQAGIPSGNAAGQSIDYTFVITNSGNVTLTSVGLSDPKLGPLSCPDTSLAPAASTTCHATYELTQGDVDAGHVANLAVVTATAPDGSDVTAEDETDTPIAGDPVIALEKVAGAPSGNSAGSTIDYTFTVTNAGNVSLSAVGVTDPKVGAVTCADTELAPADIDNLFGVVRPDSGGR